MNDDDHERTQSCRYVLYSELPSGDVELTDPVPAGEPAPENPPRWLIMVKRPSEPPESGK